ncbi:tetratricopeptide repeat protein [Patulibacter brassicae]|jgi:tetratricopeptide (TPR) repeat protein|uniref:Tetratricopeptide repeat protein n=1 Tax=Patulibacter brassicae TaxID=1705717 RepID=A0ABU4VJC1_9ACTN|nr:tetratricopeptide repeat protein [Patulibacter brassicae]MDX8151942.1 tetratricopeptide repeat protein [Patulibacter brassicae]
MVAPVFDIEHALGLLELQPPFEKRDVQQARRTLAKRWHPDLAPPGRQMEHERHLKAINEAADRLERLAEGSHGGKVSVNAVKVNAAAARAAREEAGRRAYEASQAAADREQHDPFGSRMPDHSVVHRYARCVSYPEWGVGSVTGVYFTGEGDDVQQFARVQFQIGIRTVPAGTLQFVDFSKPDPGAERVQRFLTAAQHALAEGEFAVAAKRLLYARDADPGNTVVLRLLTIALLQAEDLPAAGRAVRDWLRAEGTRPAPHRFAARIYEAQGATIQAEEAAARVVTLAPADGAAWERLGRLRLRLHDRGGALDALERARVLDPTVEGLLDLALAAHLVGDLGRQVDACRQATELADEGRGHGRDEDGDPLADDARVDPALRARAWSRYAHALARTDRTSEALEACDRAVALAPDDREVRELRDRVRGRVPRELAAAG